MSEPRDCDNTPAGESEKKLVVTPDGWAVAEFDYFRFFIDHSPPRPHAFSRQFFTDAKDWKVLTLWFVGFGLTALTMITEQWALIFIGSGLLSFYAVLFWFSARSGRDSPLLVGVIEAVKRSFHPFVRNYHTANARLADGREVPVYLPVELLALHALKLIKDQGQAEVLFFGGPKGNALVVGVRAVQNGEAPRESGLQ